MMDNPRINIMRQNNREIAHFVELLGWNLNEIKCIERHDTLIYSVQKENQQGETVTHRFALLYSQSTSKDVYRTLENEVEIILINGMSFDPNNTFSAGCKVPVLPEYDFRFVLTDWNLELLGEEPPLVDVSCDEQKKPGYIRIIEENPLEQIYTQLRALTSHTVARKSVEQHAQRLHMNLSEEVIEHKAQGVSYLVQNAIDYYDSASTENMTQRMLNLYYGTIAFMEAEMLIYGEEYKELSEIENVTKNGHGMITFGDAESGIDDLYVGVMSHGLFQAWLAHRGIDVTGFADSRKKVEKSEYTISLSKLLYCIPELENILIEVDDHYQCGYLFPSWNMTDNKSGYGRDGIYHRRFSGSYVDMLDLSGYAEEDIIHEIPGHIVVIGPYVERGTKGWKTFVQHPENGHHWDEYHTHKGFSTSVIIKLLFGKTNDWEVYAVMILYTLSIIVRYMPNLWARIMHGDLDRYKAVFYQFSRVAERELTQIFLEKLTGKRVNIRHPRDLV